jgi:hypothetical protein
MPDFAHADGDFDNVHDRLVAGNRRILLQQGFALDLRLLRADITVSGNQDCSEQNKRQNSQQHRPSIHPFLPFACSHALIYVMMEAMGPPP